jgi:hypothetical protein
MKRIDEQMTLMTLPTNQAAVWNWPVTSCGFDLAEVPTPIGTGGTGGCYRVSDVMPDLTRIESADLGDLLQLLEQVGFLVSVQPKSPQRAPRYVERTSTSLLLTGSLIDDEVETEKAVDEMVAHIRASFGLNVSQTAKVLRVERPTVYAWISGSAAPHPSNRERIALLDRCAQRWDELSSFPAKQLLKQPISGGNSLLDLFQREDLDEQLLFRQLEALARKGTQFRRPSLRERLAARGEPVGRNDDQSDVIDAITGQRIDID